MTVEYRGLLTGYFETGLEGVMWALQRDGMDADEGLVLLKEGDSLEIYSPEGEIVFSGIIEPDKTTGRIRRPFSNITQQNALGYWIHWTQKGFEPDDWASYFMPEKYTGMVRRGEDG